MSPTCYSFGKCSQVFYLSLNAMCYSVEQSYGVFEGRKRYKTAKTIRSKPLGRYDECANSSVVDIWNDMDQPQSLSCLWQKEKAFFLLFHQYAD